MNMVWAQIFINGSDATTMALTWQETHRFVFQDPSVMAHTNMVYAKCSLPAISTNIDHAEHQYSPQTDQVNLQIMLPFLNKHDCDQGSYGTSSPSQEIKTTAFNLAKITLPKQKWRPHDNIL